jgi:hypothetical protein
MGKKVETFVPGKDEQDLMLEAIVGRSGTLRAPTLRIGNRFFIGFNENLYAGIGDASSWR